MGCEMSTEKCDNKYRGEMSVYSNRITDCKDKKNEYKEERDEYKDNNKKLNDKNELLESENEDLLKKINELQGLKKNCNTQQRVKAIDSVNSQLSGNISSLVEKKPTRSMVADYRYYKYFTKCRDQKVLLPAMKSIRKINCYKNLKPDPRMVSDLSPTFKEVATKLNKCDNIKVRKGILSAFSRARKAKCYMNVEKDHNIIIEYSKDYIDKYKDILEGFKNENTDINPFKLILLFGIISILIIQFCK